MKRFKAEDYKIEIMKAPEDEGGYLAYIQQLDCWGDGETVEEAMAEVIAVGNDIIDIAIEDGVSLPIPNKFKEEEFSGKLSLRLPKFLHGELARIAEEENCSINQLIQSYISIGIGKSFGDKKITINVVNKNGVGDIQESVIKKSDDIWMRNIYKNADRKFYNN